MKNNINRNILKPCIIFHENVVVDANKQFEILTGYSIKELIGKTMTEVLKLLNADFQIKLQDINDKCGFYIFSKELNPREVKVTCNKITEENKYIYYFNEIKDSRFEDNYPYLFSVLPEQDIVFGVYSAPEGILLKANDKYINYLDEICNNDTNKIGRHIKEFIPNYTGSRYEHSLTEVMEAGLPKRFYNYNDYAYQDGNRYWDGALIPVYRKGKLKHIFHTGIDVTDRVVGRMIIERQKNEQEESILIRKEYEILKETIKMQDELYANVSHELRTPLNVIFSANQVMDMLLNSSSLELNKEKLLNYNTMVNQNCYRLTKLVNNILDLSKGKAGFLKLNLSNENIVELVKNTVDSVLEYANLKELRIVFQSNVNERVIACDPYLIERVMLNLISNAIKFSNPYSEIIIKITNKEYSIEILVIDTGIGMDEKTLKHLFKRYYQANKSLTKRTEGNGIGLSLVKTIVKLHGGNIKVLSDFNKGSTFIVELPATITNDSSMERNHYNDIIKMINIEFSDVN